MRFALFSLLSLFILACAEKSHAAEITNVVASIKPLHSLVATVMEGTGNQPVLLLDGSDTPHGYQLKPSQMLALQKADIVFYIDDHFESFLVNALRAMSEHVVRVQFANVKGIKLHEIRKGGVWESHDHEHEESSHAHARDFGHVDYHIWLDTNNAARIAQKAAEELSRLDPVNEKIYKRNASVLTSGLNTLSDEVGDMLSDVKNVPYIVFHDAYQYFEKEFNLNSVGSITIDPHIPPTMKRVSEIKNRIMEDDVVCVFHEPQFSPRLMQTVLEGTTARSAEIDPLGAGIQNGPELYSNLMMNIANKLTACLGAE